MKLSVPRSIVLAALLSIPAAGAAEPGKKADPDPYDPKADGKAQVAAALEKARKGDRRVLIVYGGNWCGWCKKLHALFEKDAEIRRLLEAEYERVAVDIGSFDRNGAVAEAYGADLKKNGVPYITILDGEGKVAVNQDTGSLEEGDHHDRTKVLAFLKRWTAPPRDAEKVLAEALEKARASERCVLLHLGAPWCGWCRHLDEFLEANRKALEADYVLAGIDLDRMARGKDVAGRLRKTSEGGIPWMAILDGTGKVLATSDGRGGNIGYPASAEEIAHFGSMLRKTARRLGEDGIVGIEKKLAEAAEKLKGGPR